MPHCLTIKVIIHENSEKSDGDSLYNADIRLLWSSFLKNLAKVNPFILTDIFFLIKQITKALHGFCDASNEAYTAVVFLQIDKNNGHLLIC